jgi:cephalosporin hydroxylase
MNKWLSLFLAPALLVADPQVDEMKQRVVKILPSIFGWCSAEKATAMIDLVLEVKPAVCVDIGTFGGASLLPVASALKYLDSGIVYGIDPWDKLEAIKYFDPVADKENFEWWGRVNFNDVFSVYLNLLRRFNIEKHCITVRETSESAAGEIETIDILHIDGNHHEAVVTQDVTLYLPKVRSGGYIWLNDSIWPQMQDAIDLLMESCTVVKLVDNGNCILFKKR